MDPTIVRDRPSGARGTQGLVKGLQSASAGEGEAALGAAHAEALKKMAKTRYNNIGGTTVPGARLMSDESALSAADVLTLTNSRVAPSIGITGHGDAAGAEAWGGEGGVSGGGLSSGRPYRPKTRHGLGAGAAHVAKSRDISGHLQFGKTGLEARDPMPLLQRRDRRCGDLSLAELK